MPARNTWSYLVTPATFACVLIAKLLIPGLSNDAPYLLWSLAVAVAALWDGAFVAVVAASCAMVITAIFFLPSTIDDVSVATQAVALLLSAIVIGGMGEYARERQSSAIDSAVRFERITETMTNGLIEIRSDGTITYCNPAMRRILGYSEDPTGRSVDTIVPSDYQGVPVRMIGAYMESGRRELDWDSIHLPALHADGTPIDLELAMREYDVGHEVRFCLTVLTSHRR